MSKKHVVTIPAEMVGRVRNSLLGELSGAAQAVGTASEQREREEHPEWFTEGLASFDRVRSLLDQLGWVEAKAPEAVRIVVAFYGELLLEALRCEVEIDDAALQDIEEGRLTEPAKVAETKERAERMREYLASVERELGVSA
jgi:hypothetical protein